jgi:xanthine dehydrogenase accessory factor
MAERVERVDFKRLESVCQPQERDYAVVMTRGHVHDANCERYLLRTPVGYLGVMGSRQKAALARELLLSEGYSEEQLARVVIPIGLSIGSKTPAEIAVAIAAQLIEVRARRG